MTTPEQKLDPQTVASARRRAGFIAILWWVAALSGTLGVLQGLSSGWIRWFFLGLAWLMAVTFTYTWWEIRRGKYLQ